MFKYKNTSKQFPLEAGTWNHRLQAVYKAYEENPNHPMVSPVIARGLQSVKMVHPSIPPAVWEAFISTHNTFHMGSSASFKEFLEESVKLEACWEIEVSKTGLHSSNPRYKQEYKEFVLKKSNLISVISILIHVCSTSKPIAHVSWQMLPSDIWPYVGSCSSFKINNLKKLNC